MNYAEGAKGCRKWTCDKCINQTDLVENIGKEFVMLIENNEKLKYTQVWLTNSEKTDGRVQSEVNVLAKANKVRGYKTVVFESGAGDLYESVEGLVLGNM